MYDNSLSIHRKAYDKANMDLYEIHLKVKRLNPKCKLVGIKTDCLVYSNITTGIETSDKWGEVKRVSNDNIPKTYECLINNKRDDNNKYELITNNCNHPSFDSGLTIPITTNNIRPWFSDI